MRGLRSVFIVAGLTAAFSSRRIFAQEASPATSDGSSKFHQITAMVIARGACPGTGDCCTAHGGIGCNDFDCCDLVCFVDGYCCDVEWDGDCAALAVSFCGSLCQSEVGCGQGDCCSQGSGCGDAACCELVCNAELACCLTGWSAQCAQLAGELCEACQPANDCPQPGACCEAHFGAGGCERAACCETVCDIDPTCCSESWGLSCARAARDNCLNVCDCESFGDFDSDPRIDLRDAATLWNCFSGTGLAPVAPACACADYDGDNDSNLDDFAVFVTVLSGP